MSWHDHVLRASKRPLRACATADPRLERLEKIRLLLGKSPRAFATETLRCSLATYRRWLRHGAPRAATPTFERALGWAKTAERECALEIVSAHLIREHERTGVWPEGLTPEKLYSRAELRDDPQRPTCIVFVVERHRSLIGDYSPGAPMAAFETYWPIYAYDVQSDTLHCIGEDRQPERHFDVEATADHYMDYTEFRVEPAGEGLFRLEIGGEVSGGDFLVRSFEEACQIVRQWAESLNWREIAESLLGWEGDEAEVQELEQELHEATIRLAEDKLRSSWESMLKERRRRRRSA